MNDGKYVIGSNGYSAILNFGKVSSNNARLILNATDPCCFKRTLYSYVQAANETWIPSGVIHNRETWAIDGLDLGPYLNYVKGDLKVRLVWSQDIDSIDFVGLDTSAPASVTVSSLPLIQANNSQGDVTSILSITDGNYLVFGPLQVFKATFQAPSTPTNLARDMLLVSTGHYIFP
jgi:hypothetical protein